MENTNTRRKATPEELAKARRTSDLLQQARQKQEERQKVAQATQRTQARPQATEKAQATEHTFADLLRQYETQATQRTQATETEFTQALNNLATAIVYSVLKKCIDTSQNKALIQVKKSIAQDRKHLNALYNSVNTAYGLEFNSNGELKTVVIDKQLYKDLEKIESVTLNDGTDLINDAVAAILSETKNVKERNNGQLIENFMETGYTVRRLKRKVYIKVSDSVNGWETVETAPITEIYKAVRRSIENSRSVKVDTKNGYSYLLDIATDTETDTQEAIYRRLPRYADLGCTVVDFNGKETGYTVDEQTVLDTDTLIEKLGLSKRQATVLQLRQSGYGYKAIATYLGVTQRAVAKTVGAIQNKAVAIGLIPTK